MIINTIDHARESVPTQYPFDISQTYTGWPGAGFAHKVVRVQAVHFVPEDGPQRVVLELSIFKQHKSGRTSRADASFSLTPEQANALAAVCLDPNKGFGK